MGTELHATMRRPSELLPVRGNTERKKDTKQLQLQSGLELTFYAKKSSMGSHLVHNDSNILCLGFML